MDAEEVIITYTRSCLEILVESSGLDGKWLADEPVHEPARKAAGLFIWTNTVMELAQIQRRRDAAMDAIISGTGSDGSSFTGPGGENRTFSHYRDVRWLFANLLWTPRI